MGEGPGAVLVADPAALSRTGRSLPIPHIITVMQRLPTRRRRAAAAWVIAAVVVPVGLITAPVQARDLTRAEVESAAAAESAAAEALDEAERRLAVAVADRDRYEESLARIAARRRDLADQSAINTATVRERVARMYMVAGSGLVPLAIEDVAAFTTRVAYLGAIADSDRQMLIGLTFSSVDLGNLEEEARLRLAREERRVIEAEARVAARSDDLDAAAVEYAAILARWEQEEEARRAALEAELRAQEAALQAQTATSGTTTTTSGSSATTVPSDDYGWVPSGGVEQWRPLLTRVFAEWGLDAEKCGPRGCVGPQIENALVIMRCESSGIPFATAGPDTEQGVVGLFQHRRVYWTERVARARSRGFSALPADATPWNPEHNIIVAALLVWESRETLIGNLDFGRPWSDGPQPFGHWDGSSRYCASPPLVTP